MKYPEDSAFGARIPSFDTRDKLCSKSSKRSQDPLPTDEPAAVYVGLLEHRECFGCSKLM